FRNQILSLARLPFRHVRAPGRMPHPAVLRNCAGALRRVLCVGRDAAPRCPRPRPAGGTNVENVRITPCVAPLDAARTSQRDVPTTRCFSFEKMAGLCQFQRESKRPMKSKTDFHFFELPIPTVDGDFLARDTDQGLAALNFPGTSQHHKNSTPPPPLQIQKWHRLTTQALTEALAGGATGEVPHL